MAGQKRQKSAAGEAAQTIRLESGRALRFRTQGNETLVRIAASRAGHPAVQVLLARDETTAPESPLLAFALLGEPGPGIYLVSDCYESLAGPMSYCQAGRERFVRVLAQNGGELRETFSAKVESCRTNLELGPGGLRWDAATATLHIDREDAPRYRINADGQAAAY